jgi:predicted acylesterase/phospholipase RssA
MTQPYPCRFSNIVIAGGAIKALSSIGCIKYLEEVDILKYVMNLLGTSAGSIMCLFIALGFSSQEMISFIHKQFLKDDIVQLNIDEAFMIFDNYGISSGSSISTFLELTKITGKNLIVCVANLTDNHEEYWSVDNVPNMSVSFAIRTSCSLPFIFTPMVYKDKLYIDGGIYNNFPINYFCKDVLRDVIGINIKAKCIQQKEVHDFFSYASLILSTTLNQLTRPYNDDLKNNVVTIELHDEAWICLTNMRLCLPKQPIETMVNIGYEQMKNKLELHIANIARITKETLQTQAEQACHPCPHQMA